MEDRSNIIKEAIEYRKQLEKENAELKAENERLKEDYINLSQQKDLDNARWQKRCTDLHIEDKAKADKYWLVLKEIKAIAELPKPFIDFSEIKTATEVEYDYAAIYKELELRLYKVLELIAKAESEG